MNLTERRRTVSLAVKVYALVGLLAALVVGCATDPYPLSRPCDWSRPECWYQDERPAEFEYGGQTLTATLDVTNHLVVVQGFTPPKTAFSHLFPDGNLHTYERLLYSRQLHDNAVLRAYGR